MIFIERNNIESIIFPGGYKQILSEIYKERGAETDAKNGGIKMALIRLVITFLLLIILFLFVFVEKNDLQANKLAHDLKKNEIDSKDTKILVKEKYIAADSTNVT